MARSRLVMSRGRVVLLACATYDAYVAGDLHKIAANYRTKYIQGKSARSKAEGQFSQVRQGVRLGFVFRSVRALRCSCVYM